jgi:uncharacterized surface protein with fasciclin (FAS1) repeats
MLAQKVTVSAKTTAVVKTPVAKRGATIVRRNSKGGEEGARDFGNTAMAMIVKAASYSLFGAAITKTGSEEEYMQDGPITVFAPNDDALGDFAKAQGLSKVDLMNYDGLKDVILNHVAVGKFESGSMPAQVTMASGKVVDTAGLSYKKNDIKVGNGLIQAITTVIA